MTHTWPASTFMRKHTVDYKGGDLNSFELQKSSTLGAILFCSSFGSTFRVFHRLVWSTCRATENICFGLKKVVAKSRAQVYFALLLVFLQTRNLSHNKFAHICLNQAWDLIQKIIYSFQGPVVRKPINANPRLNRPNPRSKFILRLNSVPRRPISTIQGLNWGLNLTHLARWIKSLIGG